mmetsp:Transcript_26748/g.80156  ORF Transcript_26748/g.80156 Transcript_26748/m.80156 type:complete len:286 (+) Transcript_26748:145-1002(+)
MHALTAASMQASSPNSTDGSTLPWTGTSAPSCRRASAMSTAQSSESVWKCASPTMSFCRLRYDEPPLAKKRTGASGCCSRTAAATRSAYGFAKLSKAAGVIWCAQDSKTCTICAPSSIWWHAYAATASAIASRYWCATAGSSRMSRLISRPWRVAPPSHAYAASVHGAPTKPTSVVLPSVSWRKFRSVCPTKGSCEAGSKPLASSTNFATRSAVRGVSWICGPLPLTTSNSTPSAGRIVRMSENMMTPSTPNARQHWSESSVAISGVSDRSRNGILSEYARKSAM